MGQWQQSILPWRLWGFTRSKASVDYITAKSQEKGTSRHGQLGEAAWARAKLRQLLLCEKCPLCSPERSLLASHPNLTTCIDIRVIKTSLQYVSAPYLGPLYIPFSIPRPLLSKGPGWENSLAPGGFILGHVSGTSIRSGLSHSSDLCTEILSSVLGPRLSLHLVS